MKPGTYPDKFITPQLSLFPHHRARKYAHQKGEQCALMRATREPALTVHIRVRFNQLPLPPAAPAFIEGSRDTSWVVGCVCVCVQCECAAGKEEEALSRA